MHAHLVKSVASFEDSGLKTQKCIRRTGHLYMDIMRKCQWCARAPALHRGVHNGLYLNPPKMCRSQGKPLVSWGLSAQNVMRSSWWQNSWWQSLGRLFSNLSLDPFQADICQSVITLRNLHTLFGPRPLLGQDHCKSKLHNHNTNDHTKSSPSSRMGICRYMNLFMYWEHFYELFL